MKNKQKINYSVNGIDVTKTEFDKLKNKLIINSESVTSETYEREPGVYYGSGETWTATEKNTNKEYRYSILHEVNGTIIYEIWLQI